jgi:hypothetical protein
MATFIDHSSMEVNAVIIGETGTGKMKFLVIKKIILFFMRR